LAVPACRNRFQFPLKPVPRLGSPSRGTRLNIYPPSRRGLETVSAPTQFAPDNTRQPRAPGGWASTQAHKHSPGFRERNLSESGRQRITLADAKRELIEEYQNKGGGTGANQHQGKEQPPQNFGEAAGKHGKETNMGKRRVRILTRQIKTICRLRILSRRLRRRPSTPDLRCNAFGGSR
jgi:hypothetical protein